MPVRETFWNIPHWAEIAQYLLGFLTVLIFAYGVYRHVRRWRQGQPEPVGNGFGKRLAAFWNEAILQVRTREERLPGWMHLAIFWGMLALFAGTALATIDWDVTKLLFGFQFLTGGPYLLFELVLDVMSVVLLAGLGVAIYRRYGLKPARLQITGSKNLALDDAYVLGMLLLIALTGFCVEGLRIAVVRPEWAAWSPIGSGIAALFSGMGEAGMRSLHLVLWVAHTLIAFTFIASIPFTKLFHIVALPLNASLRSFAPAGALAPMRTHSDPGVSAWRHYTWKQILDFDACVRCGRCQDVCPANLSAAELSPRDLMIKLRQHVWSRGNGHELVGDVLSRQAVWDCSTCYACARVCPAFIDHPRAIVDLRRNLVFHGKVDDMLQETLMNLGRYGNSFGKSDRMRARWSQSIQPRLKDPRKEQVEYLWFLGDYASYHPALQSVTLKAAEVFLRAGLDFGILYEAERNAGNDVRRVGEEGLFEMLVEVNVQALSRSRFKTIVTTDPHSYNTLLNEYPLEAFNAKNGSGPVEVLHYTELLDRLISSGRLSLRWMADGAVTYHDPCYLGRYNGIYDAPRRVIRAAGMRLVEMPRHAGTALCCGAGGGRIWMEEVPSRERPSEIRVREAAGLPGVGTMVVACPKDLVMFQDALKTTGLENKLVVKDLIEIVYEAL